MPSILGLLWNWTMESIKWKKRQDARDRVVEVAQEERPGADPDPGNVQEEGEEVNPAAENADIPAAEEDANNPHQEDEEEDVSQNQLQRNKYSTL